jgi:diguanylate cyclase (GGDEF)-like protein/PAS domain S-box-containing protein
MTTHARLLVVDDEELNRELLVRRLRRDGYDVVAVASGPEALALLDTEPVDLVLLDVMMPRMSGVEVLRALRLRFSAARLPVIMVTAKAEGGDVVESLDAGANDYVTKPVQLDVLSARVRTQLARVAADKDVAEREERLALAVPGSNDGLWDWTIATGEVFYSERWRTLTGLEPATTVADTSAWFERVHPDDLPRLQAQLDQHLGGGSAHFECEHRVRGATGAYRWMLARGLAQRTAAGVATRMAGSLTDISQGKAADALTGLPNRVLFLDRLNRLIRYAQRDRSLQFALLYVDLDRFKRVNDTLGHHAGDELLVQLGRRLERCLRSSDTVARVDVAAVSGNVVARIGGDEFAVILTGLRAPQDVGTVAQRILETLAEPFTILGRPLFAAASIGIATCAEPYTDAGEMCRDADLALYDAKAAGRSCYRVFELAMRERAEAAFHLETDLHHATQRGELAVYYQPIVAVTSGQVTGVEALLRWRHPGRGLLAAEVFLPVAEESGQIVPIGFWAFDEVCRQLRAWLAEGRHAQSLTVGVNLSARQLAEPGLASRLAAIARAHQVPPAHVELEISERAVMSDLARASDTVVQLRAAGFRLTLDDFGTGYASLTDLRRLPVDRLKLDRSLLAVANDRTRREGLMPSVVALAREMHVDIVAAGIETAAELAQLRAMRCDVAQGFYFLEPVGADAIGRMLLGDAVTPPAA